MTQQQVLNALEALDAEWDAALAADPIDPDELILVATKRRVLLLKLIQLLMEMQ